MKLENNFNWFRSKSNNKLKMKLLNNFTWSKKINKPIKEKK